MEVSLGVKLLSDIQPGTGHYYHKWSCHLVSEKQESTEKPATKSKQKPAGYRFHVRSNMSPEVSMHFTFAYPGIDWSNLVVRLVS